MTGYNYGLRGVGTGFGDMTGVHYGDGDGYGDGLGCGFGAGTRRGIGRGIGSSIGSGIGSRYGGDGDGYGDGYGGDGKGDGVAVSYGGYGVISEPMIIAMYLALDRRLKYEGRTFNQERKDTHEHDN